MNIVFLGGKQAGMVGLLTVMAQHTVCGVVTQSLMVRNVANSLEIPCYESYREIPMENIDLIISVHSREILPVGFLKRARLGGINVHPCLYKYKGNRPVPRMLEDGETRVSVGIHWMTENVDEGEVIVENYQEIKFGSPEEVYNQLYPLYCTTILEALDKI